MSQSPLKTTRSVSPFIAFCKAKRDYIKAANPTAELGDMGRLLSAAWKEVSDSEKELYAVNHKNYAVESSQCESGLRRSSRLRNKRLGLNFWGLKLKN
jgi:hypothetical protein